MVTQPVIEIKTEPINLFLSTLFHRENPPEILSGLEIGLNGDEVQTLLDQWFEEEKRIYGLEKHPVVGSYFTVGLDSSGCDSSSKIYNSLIRPRVAQYNYSAETMNEFEIYLRDLYTNARVFGSKAGIPDEFTRRGLEVPSPEATIENQKKKIGVELLVTEKYILCRVSDTGKGIDETTYREKMRKSDEELEHINELPLDQRLEILEHHLSHQGLRLIEGDTGQPAIFKKEPASTAFLKYAA